MADSGKARKLTGKDPAPTGWEMLRGCGQRPLTSPQPNPSQQAPLPPGKEESQPNNHKQPNSASTGMSLEAHVSPEPPGLASNSPMRTSGPWNPEIIDGWCFKLPNLWSSVMVASKPNIATSHTPSACASRTSVFPQNLCDLAERGDLTPQAAHEVPCLSHTNRWGT